MSIEAATNDVILFGITLSQATVFNMSGLFGGFFPFFYDLLSRQKKPPQQKVDLNLEFFFTKALLIPLLALIVTGFAVAFGNITSWLAALYLGASLPILVEKVLGESERTVESLANAQ